MKTNLEDNNNLSGINDIEKFSRKLVLKKVNPKELCVFYNDISKLLKLYNNIKTDKTVNNYINNCLTNYSSCDTEGTDNINDLISTSCNSILNHIDKSFYIERCSQICNLNSEFLSSITTQTDFFIKKGVSLEIDQLFDDCIHARKKLDSIREWLSCRVATIEKVKKTSTKSKSKSYSTTKQIMACIEVEKNDLEIFAYFFFQKFFVDFFEPSDVLSFKNGYFGSWG